jgi:hypothetical protein
MAVLKDEEEQKGQGTSQALAGGVQPQEPQEATAQPQMSGSTAPSTIGGGETTSPSVKAMPKQQKAGTGTFANLKSYLQAAQGGGRVSQAATQRVQNVAGQAQKGIQKAQQTFGAQMQAGSGPLFQAGQNEEAARQAAQAESARVLGLATDTTYQAPPAAPAPTEGQAPAQPVQQPQQYFDPKDVETYSNIINAQYQGPQSLQQAGLYEQAARKAQVAQQALQQTQTAAGREQLLRDVYGRNREYTRGQSKLDALLLNASQPAVQSLQQQAQQAGNIQQQLQEAQNLSANEAAQRAAAIQGISSTARGEFTTARTAEEKAANDRIAAVQANWSKLPEYFKEALKSGTQLTQQEADILGVTAGQGFYNLTPEQIVQTKASEANRLISKNELSRQLALQQLANLDTSKQLQKDLLYTDLEKAGTQTAADAIDRERVKNILGTEETGFLDYAKGTNILGEGSKKHKETGAQYKTKVNANLGDILKDLGYTSTTPTLPINQYNVNPENFQRSSNVGDFYGETDVKRNYATDTADAAAVQDLQRRLSETLNARGFSNRATIGETETTQARAAALKNILEGKYK